MGSFSGGVTNNYFQDIEPNLLTKDKKSHYYQSGLLYSIKPTGDIELDALKNYLRVNVVLVACKKS